jgi:hypothetical protein
MAGRLPPLTMARDAEFHRQRILKERRLTSSESSRPSTSRLSAAPVVPVFKRPGESQYMARAFNGSYVYAAPVFKQPFDQRPMTSNDLLRPDALRPTSLNLPPRSPNLREELTRGAWYEPPLIMSRGFNEPPRVFRHYLESSTASRHNPAVPVLHWKPGTRL